MSLSNIFLKNVKLRLGRILKNKQKSKWSTDLCINSSDKSKNFLLKSFLKILQNGSAHVGSKPFMKELLPP